MDDVTQFVNEEVLTGKFITWELADKAFIVWLLLLAIFFAGITLILRFHWKNYGVTEQTLDTLRKIYFRVSFVILLIIIAAAGIYFKTP